MNYEDWEKEVVHFIQKLQKEPFASYKKNKWKPGGRTFKRIFSEGLSPKKAANLWALNHEKIR